MKRSKRTEESKALITGAMFALLENNAYEDITVSDICTLSTVSRNTFYRNFGTKDAVLDQYLQAKCHNIIRQFEQKESYDPLQPTDSDLLRAYERYFAYWLQEQALIRILMRRGLHNRLLYALTATVANSYSDRWVQEYFSDYPDYYYNWLASSLYSILISWAGHGFDLQPRQVADLLIRISSSVTEKKDE